MGSLQQLNTSAELLIEPPSAIFVFFAHHVRARIASQRAEQRNGTTAFRRGANGFRGHGTLV
jgi:hypothetical protein